MSGEFNLYPFHVFRLVARLGTVTKAAQELLISQPAVSAHLRSLEHRYEESFFERTPRGMLLTPAGETISEQVNKLFAIYEGLPAAVDALRGRVRGEIPVAASSTPGTHYLPEMLSRFQSKYPDAQPTLIIGDSAQVLEWLRNYRIPLGVVGEMKMGEGLHRLEIGADELRLVTAAADSLCRVRQVRPGTCVSVHFSSENLDRAREPQQRHCLAIYCQLSAEWWRFKTLRPSSNQS